MPSPTVTVDNILSIRRTWDDKNLWKAVEFNPNTFWQKDISILKHHFHDEKGMNHEERVISLWNSNS